MNQDIVAYQQKLKENISVLIENGKLKEAKGLLNQYERIVKDDIDVYSIKGVISIMEGDIDEAERVLKEGLVLDASNFDVLYNLGYLYQTNNNNLLAIEYYKRALKNGENEEIKDSAYEILKALGVEESKEEIIRDVIDEEKILLEKAKEEINPSEEMNNLKKQFKENIQSLIEQGSLEEAKELLKQYEEIVKDDIDVYSIKGVIAIMKGNIDEAKIILNQGLTINSENFDLNYNLAYLYEQKKQFSYAVQYYKKALRYCKDENISKNINDIIEKISSDHNIETFKNKKRIVFFVKQGMDNFLSDIINGLFNEYEIKKIIVTDYKQIEQGMHWADICWFEWCDELIIYGSKLPIAKEKKIICRLHRYEAFTDYPKNVMWENVDKLIIVTEHLKKFLISQIPDIEQKVNIITINNGVNLDKFEFKKRNRGFNIAYVGYIHQRKNPVLLLQTINKLIKKDKRYKLYVAGQFQDALIELYWNYQVEQMGLQDNIIFQGWQKNINRWLEDKSYIISTSIHESFGYGIAEAMSIGLKPIIHNFIFAKEIWDDKYLFNTIDEAINMITDKNYDSEEYREFIKENYSLEKQMKEIKNVLDTLEKVNPNKLSLEYLISKYIEFVPYTYEDIDKYNFDNSDIRIGKIENINSSLNLIEFIVKNKEGKQLLLQNIWYNTINKETIFPEYILKSKNKVKVKLLIDKIFSYNLRYNNHIAGFINDNEILKDIKENQLAYTWERGIPGTQFMPALGYLKIIERYVFASKFIKSTDEVLEAASGFGYGAAYFSKLCSKVYALDLAKENIEFGKSTYSTNNVEWIYGDVTKLPFKDNKFNVYTSFETLEHLPLDKIDKYFEEAIRVLKKDGCMILSTPNRETRKHINNPFHIKEYNFYELDSILKKYFENIIYYSVIDYKVEEGFNENAVNIVAVCSNSDIDIYKKQDKESINNLIKSINEEKLYKNNIIKISEKNYLENAFKIVERIYSKSFMVNSNENIEEVTFIIPTFNRADMLYEDIKYGLKFGNVSKIIVDDGSDKSNKIVLNNILKQKNELNIKKVLISTENRGVAFARKKGLNHVNTKLVAFLDDDDCLISLDNNYEIKKYIKKVYKGTFLMIPRYVFNLYEDGKINIGYDRKIFDGMLAEDVLKIFATTGEISVFSAGAIYDTKELRKNASEDFFKVGEDHVMLSRILANNIGKKVKVTESYFYVRRCNFKTLSGNINKEKMFIHLISLLVSSCHCLVNNIINKQTFFDAFKERVGLLQNIYGFGKEIGNILEKYLNKDINSKALIQETINNGILDNLKYEDLPKEFYEIMKYI
ncbi:Tetratricopeptide repeat-containing protein [Clostridium cochlearium]|uniref:Tetratricopeptide repeat-containing protein n=2 Tax=Clostridium cochlearium TaxID=1494 RepID=A0ABY0QMS5_CLOCO|nr:methyltransferase domain-containing protein [Clostridium cochlearium]SDL29777.1 Tetratricopeptide repeat-containing protein [Clostridium cochlearium]